MGNEAKVVKDHIPALAKGTEVKVLKDFSRLREGWKADLLEKVGTLKKGATVYVDKIDGETVTVGQFKKGGKTAYKNTSICKSFNPGKLEILEIGKDGMIRLKNASGTTFSSHPTELVPENKAQVRGQSC